MLTVAVAISGLLGSAVLTRAARRAAAGDHVRRLGGHARWRLPTRIRGWSVRALADADLDLEPEAACELWLGGVLAATLLAAGVARGFAVPVGLTALIAAPIGLRVARGRAQRRFVAALPGGLEHVAAGLRGGASVADAITTLSEGSTPLAPDLRRIRARAGLGLGLADALGTWPHDRPLPSVRAVAGALAVAASIGGRAADALDGLAASLRERMGAIAEARALSAQARLSAVVVGGAPVAYLAFTALVDPASVQVLVATPAGRVCLGIGIGLDALAIVWMRHIVREDDAS